MRGSRATAHLEDPVTRRDIFGVVRGRCTEARDRSETAGAAYSKLTAEYSAAPGDGRPHPHNDVSITKCSACGCMPEAHVAVVWETSKAAGNDAFEAGAFDTSVMHYSAAIAAKPRCAILLSNRAAAFAATGRHCEALSDARAAISIDPRWSKAHGRAGAALAALGQHGEAAAAFASALRLEPERADYLSAMQAAQRAARTAAAHPGRQTASSSIDPSRPQAAPCGDSAGGRLVRPDGAGCASTPRCDDVSQASAALSAATAAALHGAAAADEAYRAARRRLAALRWRSLAVAALHEVHCEDRAVELAQALLALLRFRRGTASQDAPPPGERVPMPAAEEVLQPARPPSPSTPPFSVDSLAAKLRHAEQAAEAESPQTPQSADASWAEAWEAEQWAAAQEAATSTARKAQPGRPSRAALPVDALRALFGTHSAVGALEADSAGVCRGACSSCVGDSACAAFKPFVAGMAVSPNLSEATFLALALASPRSRCAGCGCSAEHHLTEEQQAARRAQADAAARALNGERMAARRRVVASQQRAAAAASSTEPLLRSSCDAISGAELRACSACSCSAFEVWYTPRDAMLPEVMFHCSRCGCAAAQHAKCPEWQAQQAAAEAISEARRREGLARQRERDAAARRREGARPDGVAAPRASMAALLRVLDAPPGATRAQANAAYKRAALRHHPDKVRAPVGDAGDAVRRDAASRFEAATAAWRALETMFGDQ